jgi:hypothetical protein
LATGKSTLVVAAVWIGITMTTTPMAIAVSIPVLVGR